RDALGQYDGEIIRFYLLTTHYRANFNFSLEDLEASKKRLDKLYRLKKRVDGTEAAMDNEFRAEFLSSLEDDLNISKALACLDERVQAANEAMDKNPKDKEAKAKAAYAVSLAFETLGVGGKNATEYFQLGVNADEKAKIEELINKRVEAKKAKDFAAADAIRDALKAKGVELMDTASGTLWEKA
ncbi:MAG TPA: cysteine--tRNA ligase, partial [Campylobacterales bacterium]|nr:cysteine--tRNA ligase [Campylobacterales bacterium]